MVLRNRFRWLKRQLPSIRYQIPTKQSLAREAFYPQLYLCEATQYYHSFPELDSMQLMHMEYAEERWKEKQKELWKIPIIRQIYDDCNLEDCRRRLH